LDYQTFDIPTVQAADTFTANHQRLRAELAGGSAPIPPIWLATTGARPSLRMAAEHRYGLLLAGNGAKLSAAVADFRDEWHRLHDDEPQIALFRAVHIADTRKRAHSEIADHAAWYVNQMSRLQPGQPSPTLAEVVSTFCILGSPAECIDTIQALHAETGLTELACVFGIGGAPASLALTAMERFAEEVAPNLAAMP
jgi:alkanesulfonate monooxygenase SsuD/methylene tetrahydromethanopterin reductase-like flavin-dependent oxidoreductase (luciferase family)